MTDRQTGVGGEKAVDGTALLSTPCIQFFTFGAHKSVVLAPHGVTTSTANQNPQNADRGKRAALPDGVAERAYAVYFEQDIIAEGESMR